MAKNLKGASDDEMSAKENSQVDAINTAENSCHPEENLGACRESDIPETRKITEDSEDVHKTEALIRRPSEPSSFELQTPNFKLRTLNINRQTLNLKLQILTFNFNLKR